MIHHKAALTYTRNRFSDTYLILVEHRLSVTDTLPGMNPHCSTAVLGFPRDGLMHQLGIWVVHLYKYLLDSALSPFPFSQLSANFELFLALISYDRSFHSDNVLLYTI